VAGATWESRAGTTLLCGVPDAKPSGTACLSYTTRSVNDNFYLCANGINDGKYAYNNLQQYDGNLVSQILEDLAYGDRKPGICTSATCPPWAATIPAETGANAAYCLAGEQRCTAPEYAVVELSCRRNFRHTTSLSFRSDFLDDKRGQRTGFATKYSENTIMWCHWIGHDRAACVRNCALSGRGIVTAYDNGRRHNQLHGVASDLIFHF
jgi:hypothetical protein